MGELTLKERNFGTETAYMAKGEPCGRISVTSREADILTDMAEGERVLEIGTGLGVSTRALLKTAERVTTIDIALEKTDWVFANVVPDLEALGARCLREIPGDETYSLAFIDGNHGFWSCVNDIIRVTEVMDPDGTIILHDMHLLGVKQAIAHLKLKPIPLGTALNMGTFIV